MLKNYFYDHGGDMWNICFREYNGEGTLTELVSCKSEKIKTKWKTIHKFLSNCKDGYIREVQFCRKGKQMPSLISNGKEIKYEKPISAMLPLFTFAREQGITI